MAALLDEFTAIVSVLNEAEIKYAVCGGMAMAIHGFMRTNLYIEFLVSPEASCKFETIAIKLGYEIDLTPSRYLKSTFGFTRYSKVDQGAGEPIGIHVYLVTEELSETWNERELFATANHDLTVVSKNGLVFMMRNSGRAQEEIDVDNVPESCDMSPDGVLGRIRRMNELWELSVALMRAGKGPRKTLPLPERLWERSLADRIPWLNDWQK